MQLRIRAMLIFGWVIFMNMSHTSQIESAKRTWLATVDTGQPWFRVKGIRGTPKENEPASRVAKKQEASENAEGVSNKIPCRHKWIFLLIIWRPIQIYEFDSFHCRYRFHIFIVLP